MMCKVMGIVNVTPDSFSDGGKFNTPEEAIRRAKNLIEEGAAIIDIGGESTRPGATPLKWDEEWARVEPVLRGLSPQLLGSVPISIDTYHPETAERAIALGVSIVNCVFKEPIRDMAAICVKNNAELVIPCRISDFSKGTVPSLKVCPIFQKQSTIHDLYRAESSQCQDTFQCIFLFLQPHSDNNLFFRSFRYMPL
jgi:dihydropteroate synthase